MDVSARHQNTFGGGYHERIARSKTTHDHALRRGTYRSRRRQGGGALSGWRLALPSGLVALIVGTGALLLWVREPRWPSSPPIFLSAGPRKRAARPVDQGLRPDRHRAPLSVLGGKPRGRELRRDPPDPDRRDRRGRGQELLLEPGSRHPRDHARGLRRCDQPEQRPGRRVDHHAAARQTTDRRRRGLAQAKDPRRDPGDRGDEHLLEGADPRALLQPDLLREPGNG